MKRVEILESWHIVDLKVCLPRRRGWHCRTTCNWEEEDRSSEIDESCRENMLLPLQCQKKDGSGYSEHYRPIPFFRYNSVWNKSRSPDRSGVYLQCHAVYTEGTLQHMQCTCSIGGLKHFCTLHLHCQQVAVYMQPTLQLHWNYTAYTLHFGLGHILRVGVLPSFGKITTEVGG